MKDLDNRLVDSLATDYIRKGGDGEELCRLVVPVLEWEARKKALSTGLDRDELFGEFQVAFVKALKAFKPDENLHFMVVLHYFIKKMLTNLLRVSKSQKRSGTTFYIESPVNTGWDDAEQVDYHDVLSRRGDNTESEVIAREIRKTLADYATVNERNGKIIKMLANGCTNQEIANSIGASRYDAKTRKIVQRARQGFQTFLEKGLAS